LFFITTTKRFAKFINGGRLIPHILYSNVSTYFVHRKNKAISINKRLETFGLPEE